jgi:trimethylguanosine synthase
VGGNAIAFARSGRWEQVFAVEKDPKTMKCAKHNAEIYGVEKKIVFHTGDCFDIMKRFMGKNNIIIFGSPPWGGKNISQTLLTSSCANIYQVRNTTQTMYSISL